jgi:hypothetical protein
MQCKSKLDRSMNLRNESICIVVDEYRTGSGSDRVGAINNTFI